MPITPQDYNDDTMLGKHLSRLMVNEIRDRLKGDVPETLAHALCVMAAEIDALKAALAASNIGERVADSLDAQTLKVGGEDVTDASNHTATFSQASSRTNLTTGEKLSAMFSKIAKWLADLKTVAFTGSYNDLSNKPNIPSSPVQSDWNESSSSSLAYIKNKPGLATVATSGSYNDLSNKPTIPAAVTVDQTYNASSANPQSGTAVAGAIATKQDSIGTEGSSIQPVYFENGIAKPIPKESGKDFLTMTVAGANFATSAGKWSSARSFTIKDDSKQHTGTANPNVDGSSNVVLLLPSEIDANVHGLADAATVAKTMRYGVASFNKATGFRLLARIAFPEGQNDVKCLFRAFISRQYHGDFSTVRYLTVSVRHGTNDNYFTWRYLDDSIRENITISVRRKTDDNSVLIYAACSDDGVLYGVKIELLSCTDSDGALRNDSFVTFAANSGIVQSPEGTSITPDSNTSGVIVRTPVARGDDYTPVYIDANGMVKLCSNVQPKIPDTGDQLSPIYFNNGSPIGSGISEGAVLISDIGVAGTSSYDTGSDRIVANSIFAAGGASVSRTLSVAHLIEGKVYRVLMPGTNFRSRIDLCYGNGSNFNIYNGNTFLSDVKRCCITDQGAHSSSYTSYLIRTNVNTVWLIWGY